LRLFQQETSRETDPFRSPKLAPSYSSDPLLSLILRDNLLHEVTIVVIFANKEESHDRFLSFDELAAPFYAVCRRPVDLDGS
jgi:hypothetical protein